MTLVRGCLALLVGLSVMSGCAKPSSSRPGRRVVCTCSYLTDFDDTARVGVDVCVEEGRVVDAEARRCAASSAHNHIERCECGPPSAACDPRAKDACTNH